MITQWEKIRKSRTGMIQVPVQNSAKNSGFGRSLEKKLINFTKYKKTAIYFEN